MSLCVTLEIGPLVLGYMEIVRLRVLDLSDPAVADEVSEYRVRIDGTILGTVEHRYGDGAWMLLKKAMTIVESDPGYEKRKHLRG